MAEVKNTDMGSRKRLFIDDDIIQDMKCLHRVLNQPRKYLGNPILKPDQAWEKDTEYGWSKPCVLFDDEDGIYKMWYGVRENIPGPAYSGGKNTLAYATSKDGVHWEKPRLGLFAWGGTKENNIVFEPLRWAVHGVIKDPHETNAIKKYKMLFHFQTQEMGRMGFYQPINAAYSSDGIHWNPKPNWHRNPVIWPGSDLQGVAFWWDPRLGKYVVLLRGVPEFPYNVRDVWSTSESEDFVNWSNRTVILRPDEKDPPQDRQFYDMVAVRYEEAYLGLVSVYHVLNEDWVSSHKITTDMPSWMDKIDVQLIYSQDGIKWMRAGEREIFLPYGPEGSWDSGMVFGAQPPFIVVGDEIWTYYLAENRLHYDGDRGEKGESTIGLARLRLDGFISLDAGDEEGVLITKTLTFTANQLEINADAHQGSLQVEILDPFEGSIPGFSREDCDPFTGDDGHHTVTWNGKPLVGQLMQEGGRGYRGVKLKFYLKKAKLYSFKI